MAVAVIASIFVVPVAVAVVTFVTASTAIVMILVLPVMMAVIVADLFAIFARVEIPFPSAMASPIGALATDGEWAVVAEAWIICAVVVPTEANWAVEPWTGSEEDSAGEPCWAVVAEGGAVVRCVVVIAVRTNWFHTDVDGDLYFGSESGG